LSAIRHPPSAICPVVLDSVRRSDTDHQQRLLAAERDRAERLLNAVRLVVLVLLFGAALAYAPSLPRPLNVVNASLLAVMMSWTVGQHRLFYHRDRLPGWLSVANSIVDITAVTAIVAAYGIAYSPGMALKAPIVAAYFIILAALPVASSTRKAAWVSALVVAEYALLMTAFLVSGRLTTVLSPWRPAARRGIAARRRREDPPAGVRRCGRYVRGTLAGAALPPILRGRARE
jgi:hypothetical protein